MKTPKVPINVTGGDYGNFYLSGIYQENGTPDTEDAECYIDGGNFTNVAGAGMQKIDGNVRWLINAADIDNFYGGGINADQPITGNITTTINKSRVGEFYGGPKFGDMLANTTVTTTALDCRFDLFFGAGYGGTAFKRKDCVNNSAEDDHPNWANHVSTHYKREYSSDDGGISTDYEYEFILHSDGTQTVARFFVNYASLSLASTRNVETTLTSCTMRKFYGGGRLGAVNGDVTSTLTDCTVEEDVFGSGYSADAPTVDVFPIENMDPDPEYNRAAGVFNDDQVRFPTPVVYTWNDTIANFNLSSSYLNTVNGRNLIYTSQNLSNLGAVLGNATLTINGNTLVKGDVYGGGAKSSSNTNGGTAKTQVNINGGTYGVAGAATGGNIYGGGMGDAKNAVTEGIVELNIGNNSQSANNVVINGSVYGCNNANGSPKDDVLVNVYVTKHTSNNTVTGNGFAISQVFGGGNKAHYQPTTANKKTTVHIHNCDNTIEYLYGGGNAADVGTSGDAGVKSATDVIIDGGRIEWVFGGGNGAGQGNPGANIYNDVNVTYHAGDISYLFGGSNERGLVGGNKNVSILNDGSCSIPNHIASLYGGNNKADIENNVGTSLTMPCSSNPCPIDSVFGGSRQANISGNVELTIEGGNYDYVFGGNNESGTISGNVTLNLKGGSINNAFGGNNKGGSINGKITVNMLDQGECPLQVHNIYGGGRLAPYQPTTAGDYPEVNLIHGTVSKISNTGGNVYGGGYGSGATVTSNPVVKVGYDASMSTIATSLLPSGTPLTTANVVVAGNVYGGGEEATVDGNTFVTIQQAAIQGLTASSNVSGDIYGGGNLADVLGSSNVTVLGGTVSHDVYGGGALAHVGSSDADSTIVTLAGGTVLHDVYGGGLGQTSPTSIAATVNGKVKVKALGGTINNMYGCNNLNGAPQSDVLVIVNDTTRAQNMTITNVFGGGNQAEYDGIPDVNITNGTVSGCVFGGGNQAGVGGGDVTMVGGTVSGGLYGGCNTSGEVSGDIEVNVTGGTVGANNNNRYDGIFGGGYGNGTSTTGDVNVTINGNGVTVWGDVYGGSAKGHVNNDNSDETNVTLEAGTIHGDLYGGGLGDGSYAATVNGAVQVTVNSGTVDGSVYGCNNVKGAPQSTVKVDIYGTDAPSQGYAIGNVFGGGNQADYTDIPVVTVHGCDSKINYVYGGGNQAEVKGTDVTIYGGNSIAHVFGGGYGADVSHDGTDVKIYGGTIDTIYGGNNESGDITGDIKVTVNKQPEHTADSCDMHIKELYGGGNKAGSNAGQITIGYTGFDPTERINYVYGGANRAEVTGPIDLTIREGRIDNVFGGNNHSGNVSNGITVTIEKDKDSTARVWEVGNVFGGGNLAPYNGTPLVYMKNGTVSKVFGGGNEAGVKGDSVTMIGGTVLVGLYGGCNTSGLVDGNIVVTVNAGTIGDSLNLHNNLITADVYGGGYGPQTTTSGNVEVNINGGTIFGDVYGGSAFGEVNETGKTTTVNIQGGSLKTKTTTEYTLTGQPYFIYNGGNVYGGGLGDISNQAKVNGAVTVNIGSATEWDSNHLYTVSTSGDATIQGNVYGCNNANGSPQDSVTVNIYQTKHTSGIDGMEDSGYALANVFGGGNQADFLVGKKATVNIYGCDNTIKRTFGGSNAAASNSVVTMIQGGRIHEAFGGGNGEVQAANVEGNVDLNIHGGSVGQSFSGSNQNGAISGHSNVTIDDAGCGGVTVEEHFCGGNFANWVGDIEATIECSEGMHVKRLYGGCKQANVVATSSNPGNVHLTVKGGTYEYIYGGSQGYINPNDPTDTISADIEGSVQLDIYGGTVTKAIFGGSHVLGKIAGTIVVNVIDSIQGDDCPLDVSDADVYGGGNQADYKPTKPNTADYPQVNIKKATVKNVFGGGLEAKVKGNPQVKIKKGSSILGNVYGGGNMGEVDGNPRVIINGKLAK